MATQGQIIHNPTTQETIKFLLTAADTNGELLKFEDSLPANHPGVLPHIHTQQEETFTVLEGTFQAVINGAPHIFSVGETVTVPAGVTHSFHTKRSEAVKLLVELRPALEYETFFKTLSSAEANRRNTPLQVALLTRELDLGFYLGDIPKQLQDLLFAGMAAVARMMGYRVRYADG